MPVLEAMVCGAPVLTSNSTALTEVAGDAARLADLQDARALGEAMIPVLEDEPLRAALKIKGFDRASSSPGSRPRRGQWQCIGKSVILSSASKCNAESLPNAAPVYWRHENVRLLWPDFGLFQIQKFGC